MSDDPTPKKSTADDIGQAAGQIISRWFPNLTHAQLQLIQGIALSIVMLAISFFNKPELSSVTVDVNPPVVVPAATPTAIPTTPTPAPVLKAQPTKPAVLKAATTKPKPKGTDPTPDPDMNSPLVSITGPKQSVSTFFLTVTTTGGGDIANTSSYPAGFKPDVWPLADRTILAFQEPPPGTYETRLRYQITTSGKDPIQDAAWVTTVGAPQPPPQPDPQPQPDDPFAKGGEASPFGSMGLRILILWDKDNPQAYTKDQLAAVAVVHSYGDSHCVKDERGVAEVREWDDSFTTADITEAPRWSKAYGRAIQDSSGESPRFHIVISNGADWTSQALPSDAASALALAQKYGGK